MQLLPKNGPFRVHAPRSLLTVPPQASATTVIVPGAPKEPPGPPPQKGDEYFKRLVLLVPSEVLALYITFKPTASSWLGLWALICLALVVFVRTVGTRQSGNSIQWVAVLVASVSFVLWIYATGGTLLNFKAPLESPGVVSVAIGVWTFLVPYREFNFEVQRLIV